MSKRITYRYNSTTCKYEPYFERGSVLVKKGIIFLILSLTCAMAGFIFYQRNYEPVEVVLLRRKNNVLKTEWNILEKRLAYAQEELTELIEKDDNNYRVILDTEPLASSQRKAGIGGSEKFESEIQQWGNIALNYKRINKLKRQAEVAVFSFKEIGKILERKTRMWASRPAIQPVDNRQLNKLFLTYGPRRHPIHRVMMDHKGLDFAAPTGTPIYATGDGKITTAHYSSSYGNVIYITHGYGFETRYAHLSRFAVKHGQNVKRGQIIGYVGNTGTSVAPHLHYEVLINDRHTNPINFFQRDLSNEEYQSLIKEGIKNSIPLD